MSEKKREHLGILYHLFASSEGEVFSGGGAWAQEDFADFISGQLEDYLLALWKGNPNRTISLVIETEVDDGKTVPVSSLFTTNSEEVEA